MKKSTKIALGIGIPMVVLAGTYFILRKRAKNKGCTKSKFGAKIFGVDQCKEDGLLDDETAEEEFEKETTTKNPTVTKPLDKTPFKNQTEGDAFRKWVNDTYPKYAKEIKLDPSGEYDNTYIRKAYKKYGALYQKSKGKSPSDVAKRDLIDCLEKRFVAWEIPHKRGLSKNGKPYIKLLLKRKPKGQGGEYYWITYYGSGNVYVSGKYGTSMNKTMNLTATYDNGECKKLGNWLMVQKGNNAQGKSMRQYEFYDVHDKTHNPIKPLRKMLHGWRGNVESWWDKFYPRKF